MLGMENDTFTWFSVCFQYFNQILTVVLEILDDSDPSIRELALVLVVEMLKNQVLCPFMIHFMGFLLPSMKILD